MDETTEIIELLSTLLDGQNGRPRAFFMSADQNTRRPFSVYAIAGNTELETLAGNIAGAGYVVSMATVGRYALEAQQESNRIQDILTGNHTAPSGAAMRVDFDNLASGMVDRPEGPDDTGYQFNANYTIYVGD